MRRNETSRGFTLIELMIVVAIIAIIAAIAIPNLLSARLSTNETASIATLRNIWTGQAQFQASAYVDLDGDGAGEFGYFREMAAAVGVRANGDGTTLGKVLSPASVSNAFRVIDANGGAGRSGYRFQIYIPDSAGDGVAERPTGAFSGSVDPNWAETTFCIYAWPSAYGSTGTRTFFTNQKGDLVQAEDGDYNGASFYLSAGSGRAFVGSGSADAITGTMAVGTKARDGNFWKPIN